MKWALPLALVATVAQSAPAGRTLTVVFQGDNGGELAPCGCKVNPTGGIARRNAVIASLKGQQVLSLDAGNALFRNAGAAAEDERSRAHFILEVMASQGVRAMAVGVRDLSAGLEFLREEGRHSSVKLLSANLTLKGAPVFDAATVVELGGLKVGVVGVSAPGPIVPNTADAMALAPAPSVRAALKRLPRRDLTIVLTATTYADALQLANEIGPDVDFIIQSGEFRGTQPAQIIDPSKVVLLASGQKGQAMGKLQLELGSQRSTGRFVDLSSVDRDKEQVDFTKKQLSVLDQRIAAARDPGAAKELRTVRADLSARLATLSAAVDAPKAHCGRTMRFDWVLLSPELAEDPAIKAKVLTFEPTYTGAH